MTALYSVLVWWQVRQGPRLQAVIQGVLTVGNAVNVGTAYGNAQGIRLDSLLKLADVKVTACDDCVCWHAAQLCIDMARGYTALQPVAPLQQPEQQEASKLLLPQPCTCVPH